MTTAPSRPPVRPPAAAPSARPSGGGSSGGTAAVTIDPVRLLKQYWPFLSLAMVVGIGLGGVARFVLLRINPVFESSVMYQCKGQTTDIGDQRTFNDSDDEMMRFMGTQVQFIKSDLILQAAAKDPEVRKTKWAKQYEENGSYMPNKAAIGLTEDIGARILPQTDLIRVTMKGKDPNDVATIVSSVDQAYRDDLKRESRESTSARRQALSGLLRKIESSRLRLQREIERLQQENNVDDPDVARGKAAIKVARIQADLVETTKTLAGTRSDLDRLEESIDQGSFDPGDDLREQARQHPIVTSFESQAAQLRAEVGQLNAQGFQDGHPEIQAMKARISSLIQEREEKYEELLKNLFDSRVESTRSYISSLESTEEELLTQLEESTKEREDLVRITTQIDDMKKEIVRLSEEETERQEALNMIEAIASASDADRVRLIRQAQVPDRVSFPTLKMMVPLGAFLCTGLVSGLIVLRELLDQRVKGPADIGMIPRLPVLGLVPLASQDPSRPATVETAFRDTPTGVITESIRHIRGPLLKKMQQSGHKTLLVLGGMPDSGTTSIVTNLALSFAAGRERVLIIDANLRKPNVHNVFGLDAGPGIADVLARSCDLVEAVQPTTSPNLSVLSAGTPENRAHPEYLTTDMVVDVLEEAKGMYDRIFVDSPPAIVSGDGIHLANRCDASLMVVKALSEKRGLVARLRNQLADTSGELLGVVINAVQASAGGYFKRNIKATHEYREDFV